MRAILRLVALLVAPFIGFDHAASANETIWKALKNGDHIVLIRHTQTVPGIGDPSGFLLSDCKTQRNLDDVGRAQARAWGKAFATRQINIGGVFSSHWCRCIDTAKLAFGRVDTWPALNSHFDSPSSAPLQAEQVKGGIPPRMQAGKVLILVTHQVNITALTGETPAMGEAVVVRLDGGRLRVAG